MKNLSLISLAILQGITMAHADSMDITSPAINPQRECMSEGMINPPDKNYRYLFSNDCRVVHVVPPEVLKQEIKGEGIGLRGCEGVAKLEDTINSLESMVGEAYDRARKYLAQASQETSPREAKRLRDKAEAEQADAKTYAADLQAAQDRLASTYGRTPGAKFAIVLRSDIDARDLNELRALNFANLNRTKVIEVHKTGPDGKPIVETSTVTETSTLRPAKIGLSIFSLLYKVPKNIGTNGGVISTNIPGLQYLEQAQQEGVIHVRASGGLTGELIMNLPLACEHSKKDEAGKIVLDSETDPFFIVNRTFNVQQMFAQGYTAELRVDKVVDQITKAVITDKEFGFKKSVVFNPSLMAKIDQIVKFEWTDGWDNGKNSSLEQILEIKRAVGAKLIDDYVEKLKAAELIDTKKDPGVPPANGGYVDEARTANRCWTERDGGLSGMLGRRHTVCGDYTYTVKVWKDGVTEEEINRRLTLQGVTGDSMQINTMAPFTYSTTFNK